MMTVCQRPVNAPLRHPPMRRPVERLVARPVPLKPAAAGRGRLMWVGAVSVLAHGVLLAALGTVKLVSASITPPSPPVTLSGTVRILTESELAGGSDAADPVGQTERVGTPTGPRLVAMNRATPPMPAVPSPFAGSSPVIAVPAELAPSGVGFFSGRPTPAETMPVASGDGHGEGDKAGSRAAGRGSGGGVGIALLYAPRPIYPAAARSAGIEGATVLRMEVQPDGSVGGVQVMESSGSELLDEAAVAAVRKWKFAPWTVDGRAVVAQVEQVISFRLNRG